MHPLFARQTPGEPVPSETSSEPGSEATGEPSNSAAAPSTSEAQPPASESTPLPESSSEPPPPASSSSVEPSASPSTPVEESSTTPTFTPPTETTTQPQQTSNTQRLETLTTPSSLSSTETTDSAASLTTVTTTVDGQPTTYVTSVPTNSRIGADGGGDSRTGLIAGLTAGLIALLVVILSGVFLYRRHRLRRRLEVLTAQKKRKEGRSLLDGEGFEDDDHDLSEHGSRGFVVMRSYNNVNQQPQTTPLSSPTPYGQTQRSASPTFSMLRSRASESGSIFREDVWPPPTEGLVDPIMKESSQVDLSRVVDEVMGPSSAQPHSRQGTHTSVDSMSPLILNHDHNTTHSRGPSVDSQYMDPFQPTSLSSSSFARPQSTSYPSLAGAAALASLSSSPSGGVASSSTSLPQLSQVVPPPPATMSSSTFLHPRPPSPIAFVGSPTSITPFSGNYTPTPPGAVAVLPASSSSSQQRSTPPISISPISTKTANRSSVPKKSSPLARRLSQDALTWLSRGGPAGAGSQSKHS